MSRRSGLLGQPPPQMVQPQFTVNESAPTVPRRPPLLLDGVTTLPVSQPNRRSILPDPTTYSSVPVLPNSAVTSESWQPVPSLLDRAVGLLDRTPTEKHSGTSSFVTGNREPLLAEPTVEFDQISDFGGSQHFGNNEGGANRRGLLDRPRTTSPHSVRSSSSPGSSIWNEDGQNKMKNILPIASLATPVMRPGLLDRPTPSAAIVNGPAEPWIAICERISRKISDESSFDQGLSFQDNGDAFTDRRTSARSRSRSPNRRVNQRRSSEDKGRRSRSGSRFSRGSSRELTNKPRSRSPRIRKKSRWTDAVEAKPDDGGLEKGRKTGISFLDRTLEEKEADALLQFSGENQATSLEMASVLSGKSSIGSNCIGSEKADGDHGSKEKSEAKASPSKVKKKDGAELAVARKPRIPTGYRRMCVMVSKLLPLELKLIANWRYCKFIANSPQVHLDRLPNDVVESVQRRYAEENGGKKSQGSDDARNHLAQGKTNTEEQKMDKKQEEPMAVHLPPSTPSTADESKSETVEKTGEKLKSLVAKQKPKAAGQGTNPKKKPFLDIPGMPTKDSLWNFKIKKKTSTESEKSEPPKQVAPSQGSWQKPPAKTPASYPKPDGPNTSGNKRRLSGTSGPGSGKAETEYVSPLMRMEAETAAKRQKEEQQERKRIVSRATKVQAGSRPPPLPLLPLPSGVAAVEPNGEQRNTEKVSTVSPTLSMSSHPSLRSEIVNVKAPTPPPEITTPVVQRRTLLGAAPLLPTPAPVTGPRTPPHPPPWEAVTTGRRLGPLLGDHPPVLPNWVPDPPRNEPLQRVPLLEQPPELRDDLTQKSQSPPLMADGTPFDPMAFLNRCSDYSSDSDTSPSPKDAASANDRTKEVQPSTEASVNVVITPSQPDVFLQVENGPMEDRWHTSIPSEENSNSGSSAVAAPTNLDLEAEAQMTLSILRLVDSLEKSSKTDSEPSNDDGPGRMVDFNGAAHNDEDDDDDSYNISHLRNIIQMFLDEPSSILQTDINRRRKAMELLPVLDELEEFARQHPAAVSSNFTTPIMQFVHEIVELSSTDRSFGIPASMADNESGIISRMVTEKSAATPRNDTTPTE